MNQIKPDKKTFFFNTYIILFVIILLELVLFRYINKGADVRNLVLVAIVLCIFGIFLLVNKKYQYKKTFYIFHHEKIIKKSGGIFSDNEVELNIKNITFIKLKLPFLKNWFFKSGQINISSTAGGIYIGDIVKPVDFYKYIVSLMEYNGFNLKKDNLIVKEKPKTAGVIIDMISLRKSGSLFKLLNYVYLVTMFFIVGPIFLSQGQLINLGVLIGFYIVFLIIALILVYKDYMARTYYLYDSMILYHEGFLDKYESIVPLNNLSDSHINQDFLSRIFGVYDITISSKGLAAEILFSNMGNGEKLSDAINDLIKKQKPILGVKNRNTNGRVSVSESVNSEIGLKIDSKKDDVPIIYSSDYTGQISPSVLRAIAPFFPLFIAFPLIPFLIIAIIGIAVKVGTTTYYVKEKSISMIADFINKSSSEFTNEKVTGLVIKRNIVDTIFKTMSIDFWSIGTMKSINFSVFKEKDIDVEKLLNKFGIYAKKSLYDLKSEFSIGSLVRSSIFLLFFFVILLFIFLISALVFTGSISTLMWGAFILLVTFMLIIYGYLVKVYNRTDISFYDDYIRFRTGWLFKRENYVLYQNIKNIKTVKYIGIDKGSLEFDVAGSHIESSGRNSVVVSNSFTIKYVRDISKLDELVDLIIKRKRAPKNIPEIVANIEVYKPKTLLEARKSTKNTTLGLLLGMPLIFILLAGITATGDRDFRSHLFIHIFWVVLITVLIPIFTLWSVKVKRYIIQDYRILYTYGIIYKKQVSVIISKVDQISKNRGMINKMFKNGNVNVNTAGSMRSEIVIRNSPEYAEFYKILESRSSDFKNE